LGGLQRLDLGRASVSVPRATATGGRRPSPDIPLRRTIRLTADIPLAFTSMSIVSVIASAIGWSAVGQGVVMKVTDAADARVVGKTVIAAITEIEPSGAAQLQLAKPALVGDVEACVLVARPRHVGYGFGHLLFGRIAVVLETVDDAGVQRSVAIADLKRG
jgi:hypothetical protein